MSNWVGAADRPQPAVERLSARRSAATVEPVIGADHPSGLRRCAICLEAFQAGETWLRIVPAGGGYAIGTHIHCYRAGS